jgi:hypothetical protein
MGSWLGREKLPHVVIDELQVEAKRLSKTADWRPPLLAVKRQALATLRQATLPPARLAQQAWQSDRLAQAFFAPDRQL